MRLQLHTEHRTHFWGGEGQELKEIGSDSFAAKDRKDKAGNCQGKVLAMKAIDHQPWRDACLLPSLYLRSQRETSAMRTLLLTSTVIVAGFAEALSTHSCYGTLEEMWFEPTKGYKVSHSKLAVPGYLILSPPNSAITPSFCFSHSDLNSPSIK